MLPVKHAAQLPGKPPTERTAGKTGKMAERHNEVLRGLTFERSYGTNAVDQRSHPNNVY
jgi:hypothetical protein